MCTTLPYWSSRATIVILNNFLFSRLASWSRLVRCLVHARLIRSRRASMFFSAAHRATCQAYKGSSMLFVTDAGSLSQSSTWETEWIPLDKSERKKTKGVFQNVNKWKPFFSFLALASFLSSSQAAFLRPALLPPSSLDLFSFCEYRTDTPAILFWRETERCRVKPVFRNPSFLWNFYGRGRTWICWPLFALFFKVCCGAGMLSLDNGSQRAVVDVST